MLQSLYVVSIPKTEQLLSAQQNFTMSFIWRFEARKKESFLLLCVGLNLFRLSYLSGVEDHLLYDCFLCILFMSCFFAHIFVIYPLVRKIVTGSWVVHLTLELLCHKFQLQSVLMKVVDPQEFYLMCVSTALLKCILNYNGAISQHLYWHWHLLNISGQNDRNIYRCCCFLF